MFCNYMYHISLSRNSTNIKLCFEVVDNISYVSGLQNLI